MDIQVQEDMTVSSGAAHSLISGLDSLDDETTDDFGRLLLQNARDAQRMENARNGNIQPFRKARSRRKGGLTLENLERNSLDKENQRPLSGLSSPRGSDRGSGSSSSPPLNIPSDWGRKARKNHDWLRRVRAGEVDHNPSGGVEVSPQQRTAASGHETLRTIDAIESNLEGTLPLADGSPSPFRHTKDYKVNPHQRSSLSPRVRKWKLDEDFTANSLIVSTPVFSRYQHLEDIRDRELAPIEDDSIAEDLGKLPLKHQDKPPRQNQRQTSPLGPSLSRLPALEPGIDDKRSHRDTAKNFPKAQSLGAEELRAAKSSSPIVVYKRGEYAESTSLKRPSHHGRADSHELLRKLSRAASGTPSPSRGTIDSLKRPGIEGRNHATSPNEGYDHKGQHEPPAYAGVRDKSSATVNKAELISSLPLDRVEAISEREQGRKESLNGGDEELNTPMPRFHDHNSSFNDTKQAKTPVVTGAWVDTPAIGRVTKPTSDKFLDSQEREHPPLPKPKYKERASPDALPPLESSARPEEPQRSPAKVLVPTSALEAVVEGARPGAPHARDFAIGDSTINSLEGIIDLSLLNPDINEEFVTTGRAGKATGGESDEDTETLTFPNALLSDGTKPRNAAERQRWREIEQVARMNAQLRAARSNIRDARVGLRRFETAVLSAPDADSEGKVPAKGCEVCGCPGNSSSRRAGASKLKLAFIRPKPSAATVDLQKSDPFLIRLGSWSRLTMLSALLLICSAYVICEAILCAQFCQPRYAYSMRGFGVEYDAPRLPFVTVTLLFRPIRWLWMPALEGLSTRGTEMLRGAGILPEAPKTKPPKPISKVDWEKLLQTANETQIPWLNMLTRPSAVPVAPSVPESSEAATGWVESLQARAKQVWSEESWSKMEDDEIL